MRMHVCLCGECVSVFVCVGGVVLCVRVHVCGECVFVWMCLCVRACAWCVCVCESMCECVCVCVFLDPV